MDRQPRERQLVSTFVTLADTLVVGFDVVDLLQTLVDSCAALLDAAEAGIMLADESGELSVVASTSEASRLIDLMQLRSGLGPCVDSYTSGGPVSVPDVTDEVVEQSWPGFSETATALGFSAVHGFPLRLRRDVIGTLTLFHTAAGEMVAEDASVAQGLADVATIAILQERALREESHARQQLQGALDSRVVIEQAKGVIAQLNGCDMDTAFGVLREHARSHRMHLRDVAEQVVTRRLAL